MASQVERKGEKASQVQPAWRTKKDLQEVPVLNVAATKSIVRIMVEKTRKSENAHGTYDWSAFKEMWQQRLHQENKQCKKSMKMLNGERKKLVNGSNSNI